MGAGSQRDCKRVIYGLGQFCIGVLQGLYRDYIRMIGKNGSCRGHAGVIGVREG